MKEKEVNNLKKLYDLITGSAILIGNWGIANDSLYKKIKNKITITNINDIISNKYSETIIVTESKNKYYFIKYSPKFISIIESDTEYGAFLQDISIYAINILQVANQEDKNIYSPKDILKICGFKVSKKAIKDLSDFT